PRLPMQATPCPYPTLFRAAPLVQRCGCEGRVNGARCWHRCEQDGDRGAHVQVTRTRAPHPALIALGAVGAMGAACAGWGIGIERDRKSTRLNSSHVKISYA